MAEYSRELIQGLPAKPAILLSDDSVRLYLLEAAFRREGKPNKNILMETGSLLHREYIANLLSRYPELKKETISPQKLPRVLPAEALVRYLYNLSRTHSIYYLHPSFGYYFEAFYLKPHGLVYELQPYPKDAIQPPLSTSEEIRQNQDFWEKIGKKSLAALPSLAKLDPDVAATSVNYSVALDFWGVDLQKTGHLKEANAAFAQAVRINPQNFIARINKEYNERLQKNDHRPIDSGDLVYKAINVYGGMVPILKYNGPVDEPDLNLVFGTLMADGHDLRQGAALFERRLQLLPGDVSAELDLAKVFVDSGLVDRATELVRRLRANPAASRWEVSRVEALAYYARNDFPTAEKLMLDALKEDPHDEKRIAILAEFYRVTAYTALRQANDASRQANEALRQKNDALRQKNEALRQNNMSEATRRFKMALSYLDQELQLLTPASSKATGPNTLTETLLKKSEVQMMLKSFEPAIATLNQVMDLQPGNSTALLNRAIAEVQLNQFQAAKDDYKGLRKLMPHQPYVADYGLAEIAARQQHTNEEIRCLKRYLDTAPDDSPEYQQVRQELRKVESQ